MLGVLFKSSVREMAGKGVGSPIREACNTGRGGKKYSVYTAGDWQIQADSWLRFVYDGWNVVLVLKGQDNTDEK